MLPFKSLAQRLCASLLLGAASALAFAPTEFFPLIGLTLAGLLALLDQIINSAGGTAKKTWQGALTGAAFGFGLFITGTSWIYVSLSTFGGMPVFVAAVATMLFCSVLSLYPAMACALFVRYSPSGWWQRSLFFTALWTLTEWLRGWVFTGFPWLAIGYSQTPPSPLAGFAPLLGVFGLSLVTALFAALIFEVLRRIPTARAGTAVQPTYQQAARPLLLLVLLLASGFSLREISWTSAQGQPISVALLQGNVAQDLKWRPEKFSDSLRIYYHLAQENPAQLTVLPETALPAFLEQIPREYLDELRNLAQRQRGDMLLGVAIGNAGQYANGAINLGQSPQQIYNKVHLVPFGEFVPPGFSWFLAMAQIPMSNFTSGEKKQALMTLAGQKIAVNICYEDAFGEEIIRALPEATLLVNLSNVAWFGDSLAPAQHLQIAQMRALETGRMMLRATNTGMTAIIKPDGKVQSVLKPYTRAALHGEVYGFQGSTPFVRWGNWPTLVIAALLIVGLRKRDALS